MKTHHFLFPTVVRVLVGALFVSAAGLTFADNGPIDSADKSFLQSAYEDGLAEIHMAGLGVKKTANEEIKAFAMKLEADHGKANGEMMVLAGNKQVTLAAKPDMVDTAKEKLLDVRGTSFDKTFLDGMVKDHEKAVAAFEKAANESKDPDVKAFAAKTLPTLKAHLSMAQELQEKIGK
jgi:putative membrane protein